MPFGRVMTWAFWEGFDKGVNHRLMSQGDSVYLAVNVRGSKGRSGGWFFLSRLLSSLNTPLKTLWGHFFEKFYIIFYQLFMRDAQEV